MHQAVKISSKRTRRNDRSLTVRATAFGFTLIEVMVALTIIAISLGALLSTSGTQANSVGFLKHKTLAHWVADSSKLKAHSKRIYPFPMRFQLLTFSFELF